MQRHTLIALQPILYFCMLMRGIVIYDNMQVLIFVSFSFNLLEEFQKLFMRVLLITLTDHAPNGNIECCKKRTSPVSLIIMRYGSTATFL